MHIMANAVHCASVAGRPLLETALIERVIRQVDRNKRKRSRTGYRTQMSTLPTEDVEAIHLWENEVKDRNVGCLSS